MNAIPDIIINNGVRMPQLGFGVFQIPDDETAAVVGTALDLGYRSMTTMHWAPYGVIIFETYDR